MWHRYLLLGCLAVLSPLVLADVEVLGLFKNAALLKIDDEQKLVKVGDEWKGVKLIDASSREGLAEIDGELVNLQMSTRISTNFAKPENITVTIRKNNRDQYVTSAIINGRSTTVLVDTGANAIAMSSLKAQQLGVDYEKGRAHRAGTASGSVAAWGVTLDLVNVGGIEARNVRASVLEGSHPSMVLLGTSFLQHVRMEEDDGLLQLTSKY